MVDVSDVKNWVESTEYEKALAYVSRELGMLVNPEPIPDILLNYDVNKFKLAEVKPMDLLGFVSDEAGLCNYVRIKLKAISGTENEQEGKHAKDEDDEVVETLPYYKNFLNVHLLELHFLQNRPDALDSYLKAIRIPNSKKYASQLRAVFKKL